MTSLPGRLLATLVLLAGFAAAVVPGAARAAQSYDNCTGTISSLPATITTQGVWCLKGNLSTNISGGSAAITIDTNNVTIDCNDFKIGGLAAGDYSRASGIRSVNRQNTTVRNCNVRGFYYGIVLSGTGAGHLVEDNRLDNNLFTAIYVRGDNNRVRRNAVYDTGGAAAGDSSYGIDAAADVIDNTVAGVFAVLGPDTHTRGIFLRSIGSVARNNRVRGVLASGDGSAIGIFAGNTFSTADGNQLTAYNVDVDDSIGIMGTNSSTACSNNVIAGFATATTICLDDGTNIILTQ